MSRSIPKVLDESEQQALLEVFNLRYDAGVKNRAMVRMMLEAGLRVSEVCQLCRSDVDMNACSVTIREGKGGKDRKLWMPEQLRDLVGRWLERLQDKLQFEGLCDLRTIAVSSSLEEEYLSAIYKKSVRGDTGSGSHFRDSLPGMYFAGLREVMNHASRHFPN